MSVEEEPGDVGPASQEPRGRFGWLSWVVGAVLLAAVVLLVVRAVTDDGDDSDEPPAVTTDQAGDDQDAAEGRVLAAEGSGDTTTESFEAAANFEIRWEAEEGEPFELELFTADGGSRGVVVSAPEGGGGTTFVSESGEFQLGATAGGAWTVEVYSFAEE